jgi:asparagine synthase (glutamine-hydrolysing)
LVGRLSEQLAHRGPDDDAVSLLDEGRVALAHRRLAVLDPSAAAAQPMSSPDGRFRLVFNGAIYNYVELRDELRALGHEFRSSGDTEVLLAAFAQWGTEAFARLTGMFALVVLDTHERRVTLARDHFGIKPLYYCSWRDGIGIASEIKALLALPGVDRRIEPQRAYDYLRFGMTDHGAETLVRGIKQLPRATFVTFSIDGESTYASVKSRPVTYWNLNNSKSIDCSFDEAASRLRELFLESVELHLRSDVAVGAALSGGIDSSAIVSAIRYLKGDQFDLRAVRYLAGDAAIDERRWADLAAESCGANVIDVTASPEELLRDVDSLIDQQDEPFGSTSIYAQYRVFRAAHQQGIKVMLDGQGADEILGGYRYFIAARMATLLASGNVAAAAKLWRSASRLPASGKTPPVGRLAVGMLLPEWMQSMAAKLGGYDLMPSWLSADWLAARGVTGQAPIQPVEPRYLQSQLLQATTETTLPMYLRYEDRNSMAHSIESRVPFLTPQLAQFAMSLPEQYLVSDDATSKAVFRAAMRGIVPDAILDRQDKIGFATPESKWLLAMQPWIDEALNSDVAAGIPMIDPNVMRQQWRQFLETGNNFDFRFWRWANFIRWIERRDIIVS